jgi:hypothetical protein
MIILSCVTFLLDERYAENTRDLLVWHAHMACVVNLISEPSFDISPISIPIINKEVGKLQSNSVQWSCVIFNLRCHLVIFTYTCFICIYCRSFLYDFSCIGFIWIVADCGPLYGFYFIDILLLSWVVVVLHR